LASEDTHLCPLCLKCQVLVETVFTKAELTGKWVFTMEDNKSDFKAVLENELEEVEFDSGLVNVYKPLDPTWTLRRISLDPWDVTRHTLGWNSRETELSLVNWLTLGRFLEMVGTIFYWELNQ